MIKRKYLLSFFVLICLFTNFSFSQTSQSGSNQSLSQILNPDGTLNTDQTSGSFDAAGYTLVSKNNEPPRFEKITNAGQEKSVMTAGDEHWTDPFTTSGINGIVRSIAYNGTYNYIYICGDFTNAFGIPNANYIVKWDGYNWTAMGNGSGFNGKVNAILYDNSKVYAGGEFTEIDGNTVQYFAIWDENMDTWNTSDYGLNGAVNAIAYGDSMYVGGNFTSANGNTKCNHIAKWDIISESWSPCKIGLNNTVNTIGILDDNGYKHKYFGGTFTDAGGISTADRIVEWYSGNWSTLGSGISNNAVNVISVYSNIVYVGGSFTAAGGVANTSRIAKWQGSMWFSMGTGVNGTVNMISADYSNVYIGGSFTSAGGVANTSYLAKWNGTAWASVTTALTGAVYSYFSYFNTSEAQYHYLFGGSFTNMYGNPNLNYFMDYNQTSGIWYPFNKSVRGAVNVITVIGTDIYVGGSFVYAGDVVANNIAKWDGTTWSDLNGGIPGISLSVNAITQVGTDIYVGGSFNQPWGPSVPNAYNILKWNGASWATLGTGLNSIVNSIATDGTNIYAGGNFTNAGGNANADYIAKWNGSSWSALGSGLNNNVLKVKVIDSNIYAGGAFTDAGGNTNADYIAFWNGTSWNSVGNGLNNSVWDIENNENGIYIAGYFTDAGGNTNSDYIAYLNGSNWAALGTGLSSLVKNIELYGNNVFAIGSFINAGGDANADYIARWNGSSWVSLGSSISGTGTYAGLKASEGYLYVGSSFSTAGGKPYENLARWGQMPYVTVQPNDQEKCVGEIVEFELTATGDTTYGLLNYQWYKDGAPISGSYSNIYNIGSLTLGDAGFYCCLISNDCGSTYSNSVTLVVNSPVQINSQTSDAVICQGDDITFNVSASGTAPVSYSWSKNSTAIPGANNSFYAITGASTSDAGDYVCNISNVCGSINSNTMNLTVNTPVSINTQPQSNEVCVHTNVSFSISVTGTTPITYQWKKDGVDLTGETSASLNLNDVQISDAGDYSCVVSNICTTITSSVGQLTVHPLPVISFNIDTTICYQQSVTLHAGSYSGYLWNDGSTNQILVADTTGNYSVLVTDTYGCQNYSDTANILVRYPYNGEEICIVTVDTTTEKNLIVWEKTYGVGTKEFNIYRETTVAGVWEVIGTVPFDSTSIFTDMTSAPNSHSDRYRISVIDSCDNESVLSTPHKTLLLGVSENLPAGYFLDWHEDYEGFTFYTYNIYRGTNDGDLQLIGSIQYGMTAYIDTAPPPGTIVYRVAALKPDLCNVNAGKTQTGPYSQSISNLDDNSIYISADQLNEEFLKTNIYPNPFTNRINVEFSSQSATNAELILCNLIGENIFKVSLNIPSGKSRYSINSETLYLADGYYLLKIKTDANIINRKICKIN